MTPFRRGRPSPLVLVLVVLLVLTVITHFPLILVGGLVALFVMPRHRGLLAGQELVQIRALTAARVR